MRLTAPPVSAPRVIITAVDLGRSVDSNKHVNKKATIFKPSDMIFASVLTTGSSPYTVLKARWISPDGQVLNETEQPIAPTGKAATEFHISMPRGFPTGRYRLEVFIDGLPEQTREFEVRSD